MSHGHRRLHSYGMSGKHLDRVLDDPAVRERLLRPRKINLDYDMPYVGGYSTDGNTIYLDRHLPEEVKLEMDWQKKVIRPVEFLAEYLGHEPVEWSVMDALGWNYEHAHAGPATGSERRKVLTYLGPGWWDVYQRAMEKFIKADAHEKLTKMPDDYDMRPILAPPVNKHLVHAVRAAMGKSDDGKKSKAEAGYENLGHAKSHCGPVQGWPVSGICEHYEKPNGCHLVRGFIHAKGWCKLWETRD